MTEANLMRTIMAAVSTPKTRIFRNNSGMGWTGTKTAMNRDGSITIYDPRPLRSGLCKGSSDLIGWTSTEVTEKMIGEKLAVFTALEIKGVRGRATAEQINFIERIKSDGGMAGIARSVEDALRITNQKNEHTNQDEKMHMHAPIHGEHPKGTP